MTLVSGRGWRQRRLPLACGERGVKRTGPLLTEETRAKMGKEKGDRKGGKETEEKKE